VLSFTLRKKFNVAVLFLLLRQLYISGKIKTAGSEVKE